MPEFKTAPKAEEGGGAGWLTEAVTGWLGTDSLGPVLVALAVLGFAFGLWRAVVTLRSGRRRPPPRVMLDERDLPGR